MKNGLNWLLGCVALLALLIIGRPLLVPLAFTVLIWTVLNAFADVLLRFKLPRWLAWLGALASLLGAAYLVMGIAGSDAVEFAQQAPGYITKLEQGVSERLAPLHLGINIDDLFTRSDIAGIATSVAASLGSSVFGMLEVLIYLGFLLVEQDALTAKISRLQTDAARQIEGQEMLRVMAHQLQTFLGIYTVLSAVMAGASYALLIALGIQFAALWALIIFILTYIPTIGAAAVAIPALMAYVQFGTMSTPLLILIVLGAIHFALMNVIAPMVLGQTLNLSPFAIIVALTFWGLVWGTAGLFLAVPVTASIAIVCSHIPALRWISIVLAATPSPSAEKTIAKARLS